MKHHFTRRAATTAAALAVAAGTLLAVGGTASAEPGSATDRIAVTAHHSSDRTEYGNQRDDNRGDRNSHGRRDNRGDHRWNDRDDRRDNRWDGHRRWERTSSGKWRVVNTSSHTFDHRISD
ncbi:hypothetical protein [Streptomyces sp. NPDC005827]|uniref:hypothetical protein n=1 Tax=Streptomyces sp. NPDC005827 TaxID=3157070 RepID=UPI0033D4A7A1